MENGKKIHVRENTGNFEIWPKQREFWYYIKVPDSMVKVIALFAMKFPHFILNISEVGSVKEMPQSGYPLHRKNMEKRPKKSMSGKTQEKRNLAKTQRILVD